MARRELDFYPTPAKLTQELLKRVDISGTIFECCAGDGAIAEAFTENPKWEEITTNDIIYTPTKKIILDYKADATDPENWHQFEWQFDWIITNPPFTDAHIILPLAWNNCKVGMAMLLRLTYLEPTLNRGEWLQENSKYLTNLIIFGQPRPSFTADGKVDSCTTAWFVWRKEPQSAPWNMPGTQIHFVYDWKQ